MTRAPLAVYVHVPWCRRVCPYCDFNVRATRSAPDADDLAAVRTEVTTWGADPGLAGRGTRTLYFGGGTPSLYAPDTVAALVRAIAAAFPLADGAEVTLEANPGTVDAARLRGYRRAGVTRLSLGAQSLQPHVLRALFRDHVADDVPAAVSAARAAGMDDVSVDLIYGVPGQTLADVAADLEGVLALHPTHVSAYGLTYEEGTPFHRWRARGRLIPVDEDVEAEMATRVATRLESAGFVRYEISSWALPGFESRHNTAYWDGSDYLGLGPGAHSFLAEPLPGRRWANIRDPRRYRAAVVERGSAVAEVEEPTLSQARADFLWTGLRRVRDGVDVAAFVARFGIAPDVACASLHDVVAEGLVERTPERLRLTAAGVRFADAVAAALLA